MFQTVVRGRYRQLARAQGGGPVDVALYRCTVDEPPYTRGDKTYVSLDVGDALGDTDLLRACDDFIWAQARPAYSPVAAMPLLVVKVPPGVAYEDEIGHPAAPWTMTRGQVVDVVVRPGAFGDFGYCLLLQRIKPSAHHSTRA